MRNVVCMLCAIAGGLATVFLALVLVFGIRDALSVPDSPQQLEMSDAIERARSGKSTWVWLTDAAADCARFAVFADTSPEGEARDAAAFIAANPQRAVEIAVEAQDVRECRYVASVNYIGMLKKMDADKRREFATRGVAPTASTEWWLCARCRPGGEWLAVVVVLGFIGFTGWLTVKLYQTRKPQEF